MKRKNLFMISSETVIFSLVTTIYMVFVLFYNNVGSKSTNIPYQTMQKENNVRSADISDELNLKYEFDLIGDGKLETIGSYSTLGQQIGKEYTEVFINNENKPAVLLVGYFKKAQDHDMGVGNRKVLEINTISGKSINTTFYVYENGSLNNISVSTAKPPASNAPLFAACMIPELPPVTMANPFTESRRASSSAHLYESSPREARVLPKKEIARP